MLSIQKAKYIKSLQIKKYRIKHSRFLVEGAKNVLELIQSDIGVELLVATKEFFQQNDKLLQTLSTEKIVEKASRIASVGSLVSNDSAIAVAEIPEVRPFTITNELVIALDDVRDPGNMGTILRTADWFGVNKIVATKTSADMYNAKVIQASMGSFTRVQVYYENLNELFQDNKGVKVIGAVLDGNPVDKMLVTMPMFLLMGNESHGIQSELYPFVDEKVAIPRYGNAESLNVAMSTAIICDNIRRIEKVLKK